MSKTFGIQVNASRVLRAIQLTQASSQQSLRNLLVNTAFYTAKYAYEMTPVVSRSRIDSDMQVNITQYTNAKRNRVSKAKKTTPYTKVTSTTGSNKAPLAVLIVMARTRKDSPYSIATGNRWPLQLSRLPTGPGSAAARQQMIGDWVTRMVRARHSSTGFLRMGWQDCLNRIKRLPGGRNYANVIDISATVTPGRNKLKSDLGTASAGGGALTPWVRIENTVGTNLGRGSTPELQRKYQAVLHTLGAKILNQALNAQADQMRAFRLPRVGGELKKAWEAL